MQKLYAIIIGFVLLLAIQADAQVTSLIVDIDKAVLSWNWSQGTGGMAESFDVKCGTTSKVYSQITNLASPSARSIPVRQAITGSGLWYCTVEAVNKYGRSGDAPEATPFDAGAKPSTPDKVMIQVP